MSHSRSVGCVVDREQSGLTRRVRQVHLKTRDEKSRRRNGIDGADLSESSPADSAKADERDECHNSLHERNLLTLTSCNSFCATPFRYDLIKQIQECFSGLDAETQDARRHRRATRPAGPKDLDPSVGTHHLPLKI